MKELALVFGVLYFMPSDGSVRFPRNSVPFSSWFKYCPACLAGTWGENCEIKCSEDCHNRSCNPRTGQCDKGCNGFSDPPDCSTVCIEGTWGHNCQGNCSEKCYGGLCDSVSGECDNGCDGFSNPPYCDKVCGNGTWGFDCQWNCSENCFGGSCDSGSGACLIGCEGFSNPPDCDLECDNGTWGFNCQQNCSEKCLDGSCDSKSGQCSIGCHGDIGPILNKSIALTREVKQASEQKSNTSIIAGCILGIAAGVIVLMVVVTVFIKKVRFRRSGMIDPLKSLSQLKLYEDEESVKEEEEHEPKPSWRYQRLQ